MSLVAPGEKAVNPRYQAVNNAFAHDSGQSGQRYNHPIFGGVNLAKFTDISNPHTGEIASNFQSQMNTRGLDKLRGQALRGQTPWLSPALGEARQTAQFARQDAAKKSAQALRRPMSGQAAVNALKQQGEMGRKLDAGEMQSVYGLMGQANQAAGQNLQRQVGRDLQALQPQQFNIQNSLQERNLKDSMGFSNFSEMMRAHAARQQAQATLDAGSTGGLLGFMNS